MPCQSSQRKVVKHDVFGVNKTLHYLHRVYLATPLILPRGPELWVHLYTTRCADQLNVFIIEMFVFRRHSYDHPKPMHVFSRTDILTQQGKMAWQLKIQQA